MVLRGNFKRPPDLHEFALFLFNGDTIMLKVLLCPLPKNFRKVLTFCVRLGLAISVVMVLIWEFFPQVPVYIWTIYLKYSPENTPWAYVTPKSIIKVEHLRDINIQLREIECGDFSIYVKDSDDIEIKRLKDSSHIVSFKNQKNQYIWIETNIYDLDDAIQEDLQISHEQYAEILGENNIKSRFDLHRAVLETTPDTVSITSSLKDVKKAAIFLIYRNLMLISESKSAYYLRIGEIDGFQIGDPEEGEGIISIILYYPNNINIKITMKGFEQEEINELMSQIQFKKSKG